MKLIVESGATKTSWRAVAYDGAVRSLQTAGLSPTCLDDDRIKDIIRQAVPILNPEGKNVSEVHFYGSGLVSEAFALPIRCAMEFWCPFAMIHFHSDLLAAARALFGNGSGVAAIMGTGSNSCMYENGEITRNIRPGGFILGDEGSGTCLGKMFISDYIKGLLPVQVEEDFYNRFGLDYSGIVRKVYKESSASAFLASFAPYVLENMADPYIYHMVYECLESFVSRALSRYSESHSDYPVPVGVVGSFGYACREILPEIGKKYGLDFIRFIKSPIDGLVDFHSDRLNV